MTETKRFTYIEQFNGFCDVYDKGKILSCMRLEYVEQTIKLLNELHEENIELHILNDFLKDENHHMRDLVNENNQLKQRNRRQYSQLKELWDLIEGENWEILIEMVNQMKEENKRLQKMGV